MIGKLAAGLVCGVAAALPARFAVESLLSSLTAPLRIGDTLDLVYIAVPFVAIGLVLVACITAFDTVAAWWRGCLAVAILGVMMLLQSMPCFGLDGMYRAMMSDWEADRAVRAACPEELTAMVAAGIAVVSLVFGIAAIVLWRRMGRGYGL